MKKEKGAWNPIDLKHPYRANVSLEPGECGPVEVTSKSEGALFATPTQKEDGTVVFSVPISESGFPYHITAGCWKTKSTIVYEKLEDLDLPDDTQRSLEGCF